MNKKEYLKQYREKLKNRQYIKLPEEKRCCNCNVTRKNSEFHKSRDQTDGLSAWCKNCKREYNKSIRKTLYASTKRICKKYKDKKDQDIDYPEQKRCYKCRKTKSKEEFYKCRSRKSGLSDACKECILLYREQNKKQRSEYTRLRRRDDPEYRIYCSLQKRLHGALKLQGVRKSRRTMELVGCNLYTFVDYIEGLWLDGMSWNNYGKGERKWSLDHIKPCALFNLLDAKKQKQCFHYTNLQPLWNKDNFSKSSWYNGKKYSKKDLLNGKKRTA